MELKTVLPLLSLLALSACKPTTENQQLTVSNADTTVSITLEAGDRDGDPLTWTVNEPEHGSLSGEAPNVMYHPDSDYQGIDTFTFHVNDGTDDSNTSAVTLVVNDHFPNWEMHQGNPQHTGHVPVTLDVSAFTKSWGLQISDDGLSQASTGSNRVFVTQKLKLQSFLLSDGSMSWEHKYFNAGNHTNPVAVKDGNVFHQLGSANSGGAALLESYDGRSGENNFRTHHYATGNVNLSPTIMGEELFVSAGVDGGTMSFDTKGNQNWFTSAERFYEFTPSVDESRIIIYARDTLHVMDRQTGDMLIEIADPDSNRTIYGRNAPVLDTANNRVFVRQGLRLVAFDLTQRAIVWSLEGAYAGQLAFDGTTLFANNDNTLEAINSATGQLLWSFDTGYKLGDNIIVTDNLAFVTSGSITLAIDLSSHEVVWSTPSGGQLSLSGQGGLLIAGKDGFLTRIDVEGDSDGDLLPNWYERSIGSNAWSPSDAYDDFDKDRLSNLEEFQKGTDPTLADSDGDGLDDFTEITVHLTNPNTSDTDGDNIDDNTELNGGLNPLITGDAYGDADGDASFDGIELVLDGDLNDPSVQPSPFPSIDFEDGTIPDMFDTQGGWEVQPSDNTSGALSLVSNSNKNLVIEGWFDYGRLSFEDITDCTTGLRLYVDGRYMNSNRTGRWITRSINIEQGFHRIVLFMEDCVTPASVDNFVFTKSEAFTMDDIAVVTNNDDRLSFLNHSGNVINTVEVPLNIGCCTSVRDITIVNEKTLAMLNGTFAGSLTLFKPAFGGWIHIPLPYWSTVNNTTYGGVDVHDDYVFISATDVSSNTFQGIVRVNTKTFETTYVTGPESIDVTVGQDGLIYALGRHGALNIYDADTLELVTATFVNSDARSITVDANSTLYVATYQGKIYKQSPGGNELGMIDVGTGLHDINFHSEGYLLTSENYGSIFILNTQLDVIGSWPVRAQFSTWAPNINFDALSFNVVRPAASTSLDLILDGVDEDGFVNGGDVPGALTVLRP